MIIGAGKLGGFIANSLSLKGENVVVIDKDKSKIDYLPITYSGLTDVCDATILENLEKNRIENCQCLICLTNNVKQIKH